MTPPALRKPKAQKEKTENKKTEQEWADGGIIQSVNSKSIHPIYIKIKNKLVKVSIFEGIRPASQQDLPLIQNLE